MPRLTPAQRQYVRKKTKVHDLDPSEMMGELNIIPFLDIVVNLIMFLLLTTSTALLLSQINSQLPEYRRGVGGRSDAQENPLNLTITIVDAGVIVTGSGAKLAPGCESIGTGSVITVPKNAEGYDWAGLTSCAAQIKAQFPDEYKVTVTADPLIMYEDVVAAMDALRENDSEELFTDVLISAGVR